MMLGSLPQAPPNLIIFRIICLENPICPLVENLCHQVLIFSHLKKMVPFVLLLNQRAPAVVMIIVVKEVLILQNKTEVHILRNKIEGLHTSTALLSFGNAIERCFSKQSYATVSW